MDCCRPLWQCSFGCADADRDGGVVLLQPSHRQDATAPTPRLFGVPPDTTVQCSDLLPPASVTVSDNCDSLVAPMLSQDSVAGRCPNAYTLTRTWSAQDSCDNPTVASQVLTVDVSQQSLAAR